MSLVNPGLVQFAPIKDSRWLTLEVCREFQRNKCLRSEGDCKFAHPPAHVEVQNGRVICCYDSIKGKCQRKEPPCKYLHPPQHLREQLVQNGRNNLIVKNLQMQIMSHNLLNSQLIPFTGPLINSGLAAASASGPTYTSYLSTGGIPVMSADTLIGGPQSLQNGANGVGGGAGGAGQGVKLDSRECMPGSGAIPTTYTSLPGGKRPAVADNKSGIPVYQPAGGAPTYQQLAQFQVPSAQQHTTGAFIPTSFAGHVAAVPRY